MYAFSLKVAVLLSILVSLPMTGLASVPSMASGQPGAEVQDDGITVIGVVRDEGSQPMVGAIVYSPEYNIATMTDNKGWYSITVPRTGVEIQVSFIGYKTFSFTVGNKAVQNVLLEDETHTLDDAVVVAYGTQRKATVTGSVAAVSTKDLLQSPQANISNALAGRMPGLLSVQRSGEPGNDASTLRIRGVGTFAGDQDPLIMVDGIETDNYNNIDPNEIESITILKDASATAVYGVRGANGVLLIQTKRGETGKPKVSLSTNVAFTTFPELRENMNSYEWASGLNRAYAYDSYISGSYTPQYSDEVIEHYRTGDSPILYPSMDWYDYMLRDYSMQTQSNINIRGGSKRVKYFFSLGYFTQNGMLNTDVMPQDYDYQVKYRRYNFRSNFDINIIYDNSLNAFASGINDRTYTVTLSKGIIDKLNDEELEGVIAHELTHIRNRDVRLLIISIVFVGIFAMLAELSFRWLIYAPRQRRSNENNKGGGVAVAMLIALVVAIIGYFFATLMRFAISRKREFMADAGAAEMTHNPRALASALRKISGDPDIEAVTRDDVAQLFIEHPGKQAMGFLGKLGGLFATHPPIKERIRILEQF